MISQSRCKVLKRRMSVGLNTMPATCPPEMKRSVYHGCAEIRVSSEVFTKWQRRALRGPKSKRVTYRNALPGGEGENNNTKTTLANTNINTTQHRHRDHSKPSTPHLQPHTVSTYNAYPQTHLPQTRLRSNFHLHLQPSQQRTINILSTSSEYSRSRHRSRSNGRYTHSRPATRANRIPSRPHHTSRLHQHRQPPHSAWAAQWQAP